MSHFHFPNQPYLVTYQCSACFENYQKAVIGNSWYLLQKDTCPICLREQIPVIDIQLPNNARKLDPNAKILYSSEPSISEEVEFNSLDEQFFTLSLASDEILFAISKKSTILQGKPNITIEIATRLRDLAEKIKLPCYALIVHAQQCQNSLLLASQPALLTAGSISVEPSISHPVTNETPADTIISKVKYMEPVQSNASIPGNSSHDNLALPSLNFTTVPFYHPTERQIKLCQYAKSLLQHCQKCSSAKCHVYNCSHYRDILEYQRLFRQIS